MTKDDLFKTPIKTDVVHVPSGTYRVRELIGDEWDQFQKASTTKNAEGVDEFKADRALLVLFGTVHESGERFFADEDLPKLRVQSSRFLRKLSEKIAALSGVGEDAGNG